MDAVSPESSFNLFRFASLSVIYDVPCVLLSLHVCVSGWLVGWSAVWVFPHTQFYLISTFSGQLFFFPFTVKTIGTPSPALSKTLLIHVIDSDTQNMYVPPL